MSTVPLPSLPSSFSGSAEQVIGSATAPLVRRVEPVGRAFQATKHAAPRPRRLSVEEREATQDPSASPTSLNHEKFIRYQKFDIALDDYYTLLGLEDKKFEATKEEITEQYRTLCKVIHPDKYLPEDRQKAEERYKALQVGWETLTDAARRRGYDSSRPFDDAIPKEKEGTTEKTFFKVYGPVFESNARFSNVKPVPKLGDINTPDEEVIAFYDFWNNFSSWREFPELNVNTLESASCRQQKREYERENAKKQAAAKREELARVRKLTEGAQKKDPRMIRIREEADKAKNAAKYKKQQEAAQKEAEAKQKAIEAEEAKKRAAENKKKEEENKKAFKEIMKKTRSAFGKACKAAGLDDEKTDALRASLELEQLQEIVEAFAADAKSAKAIELFDAYANKLEEEEKARKAMSVEQLNEAKAKAKKLEEERDAAASQPWTHEEESLLTRAVNKFPAGTVLRWEKITDMINAHGTQRHVKDVIKKAKLMEHGQLGQQHVDEHTAYQLYLQTMGAKKAKA